MTTHLALRSAAAIISAQITTIARLEGAIQMALSCSPTIREGQIIYDCGDPWGILRAALETKDGGVG